MAQDKNASINRSAWAVLIFGALGTHFISGYLYYAVWHGGWLAWLGSSAALVVGLTVTGLAFWSISRPNAGVHFRVEVLAVLALSAVIYRDWRRLAGLEGWSLTFADFMTSMVAFAIGLLVYKCLAPMDRSEAARNAATAMK